MHVGSNTDSQVTWHVAGAHSFVDSHQLAELVLGKGTPGLS